jgi:hypothetical protein
MEQLLLGFLCLLAVCNLVMVSVFYLRWEKTNKTSIPMMPLIENNAPQTTDLKALLAQVLAENYQEVKQEVKTEPEPQPQHGISLFDAIEQAKNIPIKEIPQELIIDTIPVENKPQIHSAPVAKKELTPEERKAWGMKMKAARLLKKQQRGQDASSQKSDSIASS